VTSLGRGGGGGGREVAAGGAVARGRWIVARWAGGRRGVLRLVDAVRAGEAVALQSLARRVVHA